MQPGTGFKMKILVYWLLVHVSYKTALCWIGEPISEHECVAEPGGVPGTYQVREGK